MSEEELVRQIATMREKGFDDSFARFCAHVFSSYEYPEENLAAARMHAAYLRGVLEILSDDERRKEFFLSDDEPDLVEAAKKSYQAALDSGRPFCELFVENWCERLSTGQRSAAR